MRAIAVRMRRFASRTSSTAGTSGESMEIVGDYPVSPEWCRKFADSFDQHFGHGESPQQRLLANLKAAGVENRATIETADMRKLPFEPAAFDAIVSAYAIDHLGRQGISQALAEAARVVKPGGDFLLILIANEPWAKLAFGPLLAHGGTRGPVWWTTRLQEAGFQVLEQGTRPLTLYLLARRS